MANTIIQDIEAVEDNYGSTFRSILEGETNTAESFSEQLENRIKVHDLNLEKICNLYYQVKKASIKFNSCLNVVPFARDSLIP